MTDPELKTAIEHHADMLFMCLSHYARGREVGSLESADRQLHAAATHAAVLSELRRERANRESV